MKTLTVTGRRQNLGCRPERALHGEDAAFVMDARPVALHPVEIYPEDYALQEYGVTDKL